MEQPNQKLNDSIIYHYLSLLDLPKNTIILHNAAWRTLLIDNENRFVETNIYFTINASDHWSFIFVDTMKKTWTPFDSFFGTIEYEPYQKILENFFGKLVYKKAECLTQNDGVSCGLYLLYMLECHLKNEKFSKRFSPRKYRKEILEILTQELNK